MLTKLLQLFRCARLRVQRSGAVLLSALLACALLACPAQGADPRASGPRSLVITYHTSPANRLAFRQELEQSGVRQLQRWKDDGALQSYRVLFNRYVDSANWDAMTLVTFAKESLTRVIDGEPEHRDLYQSDEERTRNDQFTPCCSRARTAMLVLDL